MTQANKILLIKHGAFGDLIQADGIFKDIRQHFLDAEIILLTMSRYESLMVRSPHINSIMIDDRQPLRRLKHQLRLRRQLIQHQFDLVIDLQNSDRTALYQRYFLPDAHWISRRGAKAPESGLKGLKTLLTQTDIPTHHAFFPDVKWMTEIHAIKFLWHHVKQPYIALIPGSSAQHKEKRWPYYAELSFKLIELGYDVVNILGPDEQDIAARLAGYTPTKDHGMLNWFQLATILNHAQFVVGNDTGPSHLASCLGKPGLALFGPTTSVERSELQRGDFRALQVNDLYDLDVHEVLQHLP